MDVFREVREPNSGKLLFRYDPERDMIEIVDRRVPVYVELGRFRHSCKDTLDTEPEGAIISVY